MPARLLAVFLTLAAPLVSFADEEKPTSAKEGVSYYTRIRPIFQAHCQGCHQPAKQSGDYVMTDFAQMLKGGESEQPAVVAKKPNDSYLMELITPVDGAAEMPKDKPALAKSDINLIRKWIAEGAIDDTPANAKERYDVDHPPVYYRQPVITSLAYSPDGKLLAVSGFHEVFLYNADGSQLQARLVGLSARIQTISFSPDGKRLCVTGGLPGRTGEIQVWDVEKKNLLLSLPVTNDTIYGGSWSPNGKLISFGCADNTVRAINAQTGEQVMFQGAHNDWVRNTVFSAKGTHVVSVSRDMTTKLTEVATQRFVDNITSITPGVLKGGTTAVARHPERDEVVIGGADGVPKVYRIFRLTKRVIGDDSNRIRQLPAMKGRIFSVAVSADGKRIVAGSSLDGAGEVSIYSYEFDTSLPDEVKKLFEKTNTRSNPVVQAYWNKDVKRIAQTPFDSTGIYAVSFSADGKTVAAAGSDGKVRLIDATNGKVAKSFSPAPIKNRREIAKANNREIHPADAPQIAPQAIPEGAKVVGLTIEPSSLELKGRFATAQLLVTARLSTGDLVDVTRLAAISNKSKNVTISPRGLVRPAADGNSQITATLDGHTAALPVHVSETKKPARVDFIRDVNPILSRVGCNAGTCHGALKGKNGFKLSLRGYDALFDVRALTDDLGSRRVNVASPDDSLMLLKSTSGVPHVGGQLINPGEPYYEIIRKWIADGAKLNLGTPKVTGIEVQPQNPVIQRIGSKQQMRIVATYADGTTRDVTQEAFIETGNKEVAEADRYGLATAVRRGEAPMLARYEGAYAATTLTVMGDRSGFQWAEPPKFNKVDEFTANKWQRMKILPSELTSDAEFFRRVYLDLTGLPPKADDVKAFLADERDTKVKRDELIDRLIGSDEFVEYWTNKWADLLQVNGKFLGREGATAFRKWIREEVANNTPYDEFARKILTADGSNLENPAASYYKILRNPEDTMENTTHLFLAVRFNCNKCHDHPFERWTQDQYYETAAYFARVGLKADPKSGKRRIGGTAVEGAKPLYEIVYTKPDGEVTHDRTKGIAAPKFPYETDFQKPNADTRRAKLAAWITSPDNQYFAKSYVNRLWGYLFGKGIMEPIDDLRAGNPPTNPELLDYLTKEFTASGFNVRHVIALICKSRTYQLSIATNKWNEDDTLNYSHATARRLPAEVLFDAIHRVTGSVSKIPGMPAGSRAAELPDAGIKLPDGFLENLGKPPRESACECERSDGMQLGPVMAFISGATVGNAVDNPKNAIADLVKNEADNKKLVNGLFLRILNRPARDSEIAATLQTMQEIAGDHQQLSALLTKREAEWKPIRAAKEKAREQAIAKAKSELAAYEKVLAPKLAEQQKQKELQTAKLAADLKKYEATLPAKLDAWAKGLDKSTGWVTLKFDPKKLRSVSRSRLTPQKDGSIFVSGAEGKTTYTLTTEIPLKGITGVRLEALTDPRLGGNGPGRPPNGNFVLTEFELTASAKKAPAKKAKVKFSTAKATFSQGNYDVKTAIDGKKPAQNNGWAIAPQVGKNQTAVFEIKAPAKVPHAEGSVLTFEMTQNYADNRHSLGKFRLSVTTDPQPLSFGISKEIRDILALPAKQPANKNAAVAEVVTRTAEQQKKLLDFYKSQDGEYVKKQKAVADSKKPLPVDPKLTMLKKQVETASQPVQDDPKLVLLRNDFAMSQQQLENKRLTAAQDLAWVLLNTPAFQFNH